MNSSLVSTHEASFQKNFFQLKFSNSIWIRLDRFNETHWADRKDNKIILYNVTQPMFNGFHIGTLLNHFEPGFIKWDISIKLGILEPRRKSWGIVKNFFSNYVPEARRLSGFDYAKPFFEIRFLRAWRIQPQRLHNSKKFRKFFLRFLIF